MYLFIIYILILSNIKELHGKSEEYYKCLNPDKTINSPNNCININIPYSEGYKCCSMMIKYGNTTSYNCIVLDKKYTASQKILDEYLSKRNLTSLLGSMGGEMEIQCENGLKATEKYQKFSDEYLNCYNGHIKGVENINECNDNDMPTEENCKCCFVETTKLNNNGNKINDKRCYIIQDEYFTKEKNFSNYLIDGSDINNLDQIKSTDITINCKNYDTFFYKSLLTEPNFPDDNDDPTEIIPNDDKEKSGSKTWVIIVVIIICCIVVVGLVMLGKCIYKKFKNSPPSAPTAPNPTSFKQNIIQNIVSNEINRF